MIVIQPDKPLVSVVIPTRGEGVSLERCVASVKASNYPLGNVELVVVNGGGDGSPPGIAMWRRQFRHVEMVSNPQGITPVGLNLGIRVSTGDYIVILGAHSTISPNYISQSVLSLQGEHLSCVGGLTRAIGDDTRVGQTIAMAMTSRFGVGNAKFRYLKEPSHVDTVAFGVYPRAVFDTVGLFDERLVRNQDIELNYRARRQYGPMLLNPEMWVDYYCREDLGSMSLQAFQNGFWNIVTWRLVPKSLSWRHFVPLAFVTSLIMGLLLGLCGFGFGYPWALIAWLPLMFLFIIYFVSACAVTYLWARERDVAAALLLPITFLCLHVSYGLGSLSAVFRASRGEILT